jgi:predicted nicotinamide N-methyase
VKDISAITNAGFDELLAEARRKFGAIRFEKVKVDNVELEVAQVADMPAYLDKLVDKARGGKTIELPLWAKIWPSCLILGFYLMKISPIKDARVLEVGAGCGLVGMIAAKRGLDVVMTDIEDDSLLFCRLNALRNGLEDKITLKKVDFTTDRLGEKFDYIIGCEVLYQEDTYKPFAEFVQAHLKDVPGAETVLAMDHKRTGRLFFEAIKDKYKIMRQEVPFKNPENGSRDLIDLYRLGGRK